MLRLSLLINIAVLIPVCAGLLFNATWANVSWGPRTPARGILLSIYLSILLGSVVALYLASPILAAPMLVLQILYKVTTPLTVGTLRNPVVVSNLLIAIVHSATLTSIGRAVLAHL